MSKVNELHDRAMALLNLGQEQLREALQLEVEAAELVPLKPENEPSRGMLYLGAASIAFMLGDGIKSKEYAREGLRGATGEMRGDLLAVDGITSLGIKR